jgi:aminoglycoside phosphotransferase (APT) family kinase protein
MGELVASLHVRLRKSTGAGSPDRHRRAVVEPLQTLADFGPGDAVRAVCARLEAQCTTDWLDTLPVIPQHGDLFVGNVLSMQPSWYVIDWETFGAIDLPGYDLFTLVLSLLRSTGDTPERWDRSLVEQVPALIERYARELGLQPVDLPLLLPLSFANWFYLHWIDGRQEFTKAMFKMLEHYCGHTEMWEAVFVPADGRTM